MLKQCPRCFVENPADAFLCSCGYEFAGSEPLLPSPAGPPAPGVMWTASRIWWTAGAVTAGVIALVLRPSRKLLVVLIERPGAFLPLLLAFVGPASVLFFALVFCGRVMAAPGLSSEGKILRVFLILLAALVVGAALVFAGCAVAFSIRHF